MNKEYQTLTLEDVTYWTNGIFDDHSKSYLLDILTGKYDLEEAREDILSLREYKERKND